VSNFLVQVSEKCEETKLFINGSKLVVLWFLGTVARSEAESVLLTQDLSLGFDLRLKS
jgi:hypothetical protein